MRPAPVAPTPFPVPAPPAPRADFGPGAELHRPAGEVAADSRRAHDEGAPPPTPAPGFAYGFPGPPGSPVHYHLRFPDRNVPEAALAGGTTDRRIEVRIYRAESAVDGALAARGALEHTAAERPEILDPVTAGGCGEGGSHAPPGSGLRAPPAVRVVRVRLPADRVDGADAALAALPGLVRLHGIRLGGASGEASMDVHVVEGR